MNKLDNYTLLNEETLFSTANGYVGMRANFEEGYKNGYKTNIGTYINGFYDDVPICYGEVCSGFPRTAQKMVNVHNAQGILIKIDGDIFNVFEGNLKSMERKLDIQNGFAVRKVEWVSPKGHAFRFNFKRMASFVKKELLIIDLEIESINYEGIVEISSKIEGSADNRSNEDDPRAGAGGNILLNITSSSFSGVSHMMTSETLNSGLSVATACSYNEAMEFYQGDVCSDAICTKHIKKGEIARITKYIGFADSLRHDDIEREAVKTAEEASAKGADYYFAEQKKYLNNFWKYAYISINGDSSVEYALNYSVYQLLSSAGGDRFSQIGAKGLSGDGYDGHYFWDTEIYMVPFFTLTMPDAAKTLLKFRYNVLEASRKRAYETGHKKGAKIPWRTISGSECSSYFPAGSAQYHINADVAYAYIQYYLFTGDIEMIRDFGYEVVFETARIWLEVGNYNDKGEFCISTVTGPDEYTALIDNNYYTNSMAKYHLEWALKLGTELKDYDIAAYDILIKKLCITKDEADSMKTAAENIRLPYDEKLKVHMQDDSFMMKPEWDFEAVPKDNYPLLLYYHPMHIYRHKVLKQADTILSYVLLDNVKTEIMENSYDYYKKRTTHDSSLSPCVHSMMAARIGRAKEAYDFFMSTIRLDLDDINKNTKDGLHIANAGGAYMSIVYGFAGLRIKCTGLHLRPIKPKNWKGYSFRLNYRGQAVMVEIDESIKITCEKPIEIYVYDILYKVENKIDIALLN